MKKTSFLVILCLGVFFLMPQYGFSQKRMKPPRRSSKVKSVDQFVNHTFELYHKIFVYDSLDRAGVEIPTEIEDVLVEQAERNIDSLWQSLPDILEDIGDASVLKQAKATLNLNKSKKALKYCVLIIKNYFIEAKEEDDE